MRPPASMLIRALGLGLVVLSGCLWAGTALERLGTEAGLSQVTVNAIAQDRRGFLWVATQDGLDRFDGFRFTVYRHQADKPESLRHNHVNCLLLDREGRLWVGSAGGLGRYEPLRDGFVNAQLPASAAASVTCLAEARDGTLWVGIWGAGLFRYDPARGFARRPANSADALHTEGLLVGKNGIVWLATAGAGLVRYDPGHDSARSLRHQAGVAGSLLDDRVHVLREDHQGRLFIGTERGPQIYDPTSDRFVAFPAQGPNADQLDTSVTDLHLDRQGIVWLTTLERGIFRCDLETGAVVPLQPQRTEREEYFQAIYADRDGLLWFGGVFGGLYRHDPAAARFAHLTRGEGDRGLSHACVYALASAEDGGLYLGTAKGLDHYDPRSARFSHLSPELEVAVLALERRERTLWIGTDGAGLLRRRDGQTSTYRAGKGPRDLAHDQILSLASDLSGALWVGTAQGLCRYQPGSDDFDRWLRDPSDPASLGGNQVRALLVSSGGEVWVGTQDGGLSRTDLQRPGRFRRFGQGPEGGNLGDDSVLALAEDHTGQLWVGTGSGLARYEGDRFSVFDKRQGVPEGVTGILLDARDRLWLGSFKGLACFDPRSGRVRRYQLEDGLRNTEFKPGACLSEPGGAMYFGGVDGVDLFHPNAMGGESLPPPAVLTDLRLFGHSLRPRASEPRSPLTAPVGELAELTLSHRQDFVGFEFSALQFAHPEQLRFAYQLEGRDSTWTETGADRRLATYTRLEPGTYRFRVKAANRDGLWSEPPAELRVIVLPPPWLRWWAFLGYALIAVLAGLAFARHRYLALVRANLQLAEQVHRHTHTLEEQARLVAERNHQLAERNLTLADQKREIERQAIQLRELHDAKSRFYVNLSHEFRTPLTLGIGPLEDLLGPGGVVDERARPTLRMILRNNRRLLELINQLLDVSQLEAGELRLRPRLGDLDGFVAEHLLSFAAQSERSGVALRVTCGHQPLWCLFDPRKLRDILDNLVGNAFKYTRRGDQIEVSLGRAGEQVHLRVKDSGIGIAPEKLPHIFERFYRVPGDESGEFATSSGIGLAFVRELVDLHGGAIEVESRLGQGSSFLVSLPLQLAQAPAPEASDGAEADLAETEAEARDPARLVVLVIDDNADIRRYLRGILGDRYDVAEAASGDEGLTLAMRLVPDLILCDVMMPEPDGFEVCRRLKGDLSTSHVPVVLLTAMASDAAKLRGLEGGADDYLVKPFNAREVRLRIDNAIASRQRLRERYAQLSTEAERPDQVLEGPALEASLDEKFLRRVAEIARAHLAEAQFGVAELAEEIGLSRRQLLRKLSALTGHSPAEHLRRLRLEEAERLLRSRSGNVAEVAYAVGFETPAHFSRVFHKHFGVLPSEVAASPTVTGVRS